MASRIDPSVCIDCHVCGWICPEGAVRDDRDVPIQRLRRDMRPRPVVNLDLCNGCAVCTAYCPTDARGIIGEVHHGASYLARPLACVACGECARSCIKQAIVMAPLELQRFDPEEERARLLAELRSDAPKPP